MTDHDIELDYAFLTQQAMRGVVRHVLSITKDLGDVPGEHHFYVEFLTRAPGVMVSKELVETYPERMTIVLQHKFENLVVEEDRFEVTLHFKGVPDHLVIPYTAITAFVDPSVDFKLRFEPIPFEEDAGHQVDAAGGALESDSDDGDDGDTPPDGGPEGGADVVSLDSFRKK